LNLPELTFELTWTYFKLQIVVWKKLNGEEDLLLNLRELTFELTWTYFCTDRGVEEAQRGGGGACQLQEAQQDELDHALLHRGGPPPGGRPSGGRPWIIKMS